MEMMVDEVRIPLRDSGKPKLWWDGNPDAREPLAQKWQHMKSQLTKVDLETHGPHGILPPLTSSANICLRKTRRLSNDQFTQDLR